MCEPRAPKVIVEEVGNGGVSADVVVVDDSLGVVKHEIARQRVDETHTRAHPHQQCCSRIGQLWNDNVWN